MNARFINKTHKHSFRLILIDHESSFFLTSMWLPPQPTLSHYRGDSLTHPMLITAFSQFRPKGHREPHNEVGSLSLVDFLVGFEPGTS